MKGIAKTLVHPTLAILVVGLWSSEIAKADPQNLAGGVLIAHHPAGMVYSTDTPPEGWCGKYLNQFRITSAEQQVNRTNEVESLVFWFVLSAWYESKEFCGAELGLGTYDADAFNIVRYGACGNNFTPLEIPTGAWPGPDAGIAVASPAEGLKWTGNYVPIYYFCGYGYAPGVKMEIAPNPATAFAGWHTCASPPVPAAATCLGAFGILQDGTYCEPPNPGDVPGACCFSGGVCQILLPAECATAGGTWDGSSVCTDPNLSVSKTSSAAS